MVSVEALRALKGFAEKNK